MVEPGKFNDPSRMRISEETDAYGRTHIKPKQDRREFVEIMKDKAKEEKEQEEEKGKKSKPGSIFDIQPQNKEVKEADAAALAAGGQRSSVNPALAANFQGKAKQPEMHQLADAHPDLAGVVVGPKTEEEPTKGSAFTQEREDLTYVNPLMMGQAGQVRPQALHSSAPQAAAAAQTLQQIVDQIVDKLYTLKTDGRTETIMTVKNPPILAGCEIVLTGFNSAKGEFNIAFHNLRAEALRMLELNATQIGLKQALEDKGFTLHIFVATAQPYQPVVRTETAQNERQKRDDQDEGQQQKRDRGQERG